jgi:hypothetical protein
VSHHHLTYAIALKITLGERLTQKKWCHHLYPSGYNINASTRSPFLVQGTIFTSGNHLRREWRLEIELQLWGNSGRPARRPLFFLVMAAEAAASAAWWSGLGAARRDANNARSSGVWWWIPEGLV